jgi:predicted enzyme related to lactoylglutathione lyase
MNKDKQINYIEIPSLDIKITKRFFKEVFQWSFKDYGPEYTSFSNAGIYGGFFKAELKVNVDNGSPLIVIYSEDLEKIEEDIVEAGGSIIKPVFTFPGGRRFHFADPNGNEYAVWSDK